MQIDERQEAQPVKIKQIEKVGERRNTQPNSFTLSAGVLITGSQKSLGHYGGDLEREEHQDAAHDQ
jgi:hypothetical protein